MAKEILSRLVIVLSVLLFAFVAAGCEEKPGTVIDDSDDGGGGGGGGGTPGVGSAYWYVGNTLGPPCPPFKSHNTTEAAWAQEVLTLTNQERVAQTAIDSIPRPTLLWDAEAELAAKIHCEDMRARGYFDHYTPEGWSPGDRLQMTGASGYTAWGENIAMGYPSATAVVTAWMNSPGHRANILNEMFNRMGVGVVQTNYYWGQVFLRR